MWNAKVVRKRSMQDILAREGGPLAGRLPQGRFAESSF